MTPDNAALDAIRTLREGYRPATSIMRLARRSRRHRGNLLRARLELEERTPRPPVEP